MQNFIIDKMVTANLRAVYMLAAIMVITVILTHNAFASQPFQQYSMQLVAQQSNPWALPETPEKFSESQLTPQFRAQPERFESQRFYPRRGGFVTPEHLESLKRQQMQMQMTPHMTPRSRRYDRPMQKKLPSGQILPQQSWSLIPGQNYYDSPMYGKGNMSPLNYMPSLSPWSSGSGLIYRGDSVPGSLPGGFSGSSPWLPNEALGGLPPIHTPLWGEDDAEQGVDDSVFNPFTFLPGQRP